MLGFRVWGVRAKEMIYPDSYDNDFVVDAQGDLFFPGMEQLEEANDNLWVPMQSTGLKDCNGEEIFEGDVIDFGWAEDEADKILVIESCSSFLIKLGKILGALYDPENEVDDEISDRIKIFGNRFENPELLEKIE
jgi:uncharacterized phage protein (TIGR01671 family)